MFFLEKDVIFTAAYVCLMPLQRSSHWNVFVTDNFFLSSRELFFSSQASSIFLLFFFCVNEHDHAFALNISYILFFKAICKLLKKIFCISAIRTGQIKLNLLEIFKWQCALHTRVFLFCFFSIEFRNPNLLCTNKHLTQNGGFHIGGAMCMRAFPF